MDKTRFGRDIALRCPDAAARRPYLRQRVADFEACWLPCWLVVLTCAVRMRNRIQFHMKSSPISGRVSTDKDLVWVQCKEYRCLAYSDAAGQWINFYTGNKLTDFVKVIG